MLTFSERDRLSIQVWWSISPKPSAMEFSWFEYIAQKLMGFTSYLLDVILIPPSTSFSEMTTMYPYPPAPASFTPK